MSLRDTIAKINYESFVGLSWDVATEDEKQNAYKHADKIIRVIEAENIWHEFRQTEKCPYCDVVKFAIEKTGFNAIYFIEPRTNRVIAYIPVEVCPVCGRRVSNNYILEKGD